MHRRRGGYLATCARIFNLNYLQVCVGEASPKTSAFTDLDAFPAGGSTGLKAKKGSKNVVEGKCPFKRAKTLTTYATFSTGFRARLSNALANRRKRSTDPRDIIHYLRGELGTIFKKL